MIPDMPTIGARFDIEKTGGGWYAVECWKIFWQAVTPEEIGTVVLYGGDSAATLYGRENVFWIAVQSMDPRSLARIRGALSRNEAFRNVSATPMFVEGPTCAAEPLPEAGKIGLDGALIDNDEAVRSALVEVQKERPRRTQIAPKTEVMSATIVHCPGCHKKLKCKAELAGKRVKCPSCGKVLVVRLLRPASEARSKVPPSGVPRAERKAKSVATRRAIRQVRQRPWLWYAWGGGAAVLFVSAAVFLVGALRTGHHTARKENTTAAGTASERKPEMHPDVSPEPKPEPNAQSNLVPSAERNSEPNPVRLPKPRGQLEANAEPRSRPRQGAEVESSHALIPNGAALTSLSEARKQTSISKRRTQGTAAKSPIKAPAPRKELPPLGPPPPLPPFPQNVKLVPQNPKLDAAEKKHLDEAIRKYEQDQVTTYLAFKRKLTPDKNAPTGEYREWLESACAAMENRVKSVLRRDYQIAQQNRDFQASFLISLVSGKIENGLLDGLIEERKAHGVYDWEDPNPIWKITQVRGRVIKDEYTERLGFQTFRLKATGGSELLWMFGKGDERTRGSGSWIGHGGTYTLDVIFIKRKAVRDLRLWVMGASPIPITIAK